MIPNPDVSSLTERFGAAAWIVACQEDDR